LPLSSEAAIHSLCRLILSMPAPIRHGKLVVHPDAAAMIVKNSSMIRCRLRLRPSA